MNFNIYLEDELGRKLDNICQLSGKKRNTIIREALETWIQQYSMPDWPESIKTFQGEPESIRFESHRAELKEPDEESIFE